MDRFNLNKYRQQSRSNPQSTPVGTSRSGTSVPHPESRPVASTSKLSPFQNGQSVPLPSFQQRPHGENRAEPPQTRASSQHASTLSHHQQFDDSHHISSGQAVQKPSISTLQQQPYWMLADKNSAYTQVQVQAQALYQQQELQRQRHAESQQQQHHYQHLREPGWERYLQQSQQQLYHQQLPQQLHQEQPHRRSSTSGHALVAHHTLTSTPLDSSSNTLVSTSSSTPLTLTAPSTDILLPNLNLDSNPSTNPSSMPPAGLVSQLSELVAQKVFEAMQRAGIVPAGTNGNRSDKGKERAMDPSDSSDMHTPLNVLHQPDQPESSNDQPNNTHMMLLVQVIKEMKQDVKGIKDVLVGFEESNDDVGGAEVDRREKDGVIVLDHSEEEDNGAAPTLGSWRTRLDKKRKDRQSNGRVQKALKEPRGVLQRLESLEMDVQELLERLRDPLAGIDGEGVFVGTSRRQQEGRRDPMPQPQPPRGPSQARAAESLTQQQQPTIIDLTTSPSRDGTEGVGDNEMFVDDVAHQPVDDNESERTIEQGLHRPGEDDQAMDLVGDKSGDVNVGVGAVQMMQVDEDATAPNEADDVFGPLTPNSLDVSKPARPGVISVGNAAAREYSEDMRASTSTAIKTTPSSSSTASVPLTAPFAPQLNGKELEFCGGGELGSTPSSPGLEAPKLKIRLSPKVTLVVGSPEHRHASDPMDVERTTMPTTETDVLTSTPQLEPPARSATPPPGFSPVDWSKVSNASRSRSVSVVNASRSLRSTSSSSLSMSPTKTTNAMPAPLEIQKFIPTYSAAVSISSEHSTPSTSYPPRRPSEDSIAALRMEVQQSPRMSPGMIVLEGSTSVSEKRSGMSPLALSVSRSASETSPPPPPPTTTQAQVVVAPKMGVTASMNSVLSVLTPLPATTMTTTTEAVSSPKLAPSTSLMSVDSPSHPAQTFGDAEDVPSPSPALTILPPLPSFPLSPLRTLPAASVHSDSSSSSSFSPNFPSSRYVSVVSSVEEEQDVEKKSEVKYTPPSRTNMSALSRRERRHAGYVAEEDLSEEDVGVDEEGAGGEVEEEKDDEEDELQDIRQHEEEEEGEEVSMQLDEEKDTVGVDDEHQEEVEYGALLSEEEEEEEEEGEGPSLESASASIVADDKTTDEYDEGEEEPSVEQTDEDEEGSLVGKEVDELQREVDELREGTDEDEENVVSASLSPAVAANSSPSGSQSASQTGFHSSSPYASSAVSSITINPKHVDLGKVRFGPPKKVLKVSALELSQSTTGTADCEAVVQSLVTEDGDDDDMGDGRLAMIVEGDEGAPHASASTSAQVIPAEPNSEEETDQLGHSFEGGIPADDVDDNEDQEDGNLDHTFENGIPADEHLSESPPATPHHSESVNLQSAPAISPRKQTKPSRPQADDRVRLTPITTTADPKTPQRKSPEYIYIPSGSSSPVRRTPSVVGDGEGKETEKVKTERKFIDLSDDEEIIVTGRLWRGRPPPTRPILTKPPLKLELFDGPGPIGSSTPVQQDAPLPPFSLSSVVDALLNEEPPKTPKRIADLQPPDSPLSDLTPSPKCPMLELDEPAPSDSPLFDPKKHAAHVDDDDDTEIRPIKKKRKASAAATTASVGSEMNMKLDPDRSSAKAAPPKKRLMVMPKKGQSMAVTRVKKRKAIPEPDEEDEEPPLKKAMLRRTTRSSETSSNSRGSSKSKEKERRRERPVRTSARASLSPAKNSRSSKNIKVESSSAKRTPTRRPRGSTKKVAVVWPTCSKPNYDQHLQCDICQDWYHIGCVGVAADDVCLDETELYTCPRCDAHEEISPSKRKKSATVNSSTSKCARPDCGVNAEPDDIFEVEAIVGMSGSGASALYLVKWQNYGFDDVTKQTLESMELSDPRILLETFYKAAKAEGLELKTRKNEFVVLKAAAAAGWNSHGEFIKPES